MYVPSSELGPPLPLPLASVYTPSWSEEEGNTLACGWGGGGRGRLEKKPSTLSTLLSHPSPSPFVAPILHNYSSGIIDGALKPWALPESCSRAHTPWMFLAMMHPSSTCCYHDAKNDHRMPKVEVNRLAWNKLFAELLQCLHLDHLSCVLCP